MSNDQNYSNNINNNRTSSKQNKIEAETTYTHLAEGDPIPIPIPLPWGEDMTDPGTDSTLPLVAVWVLVAVERESVKSAWSTIALYRSLCWTKLIT